jgi:NAD-dependent dihydropyrimidine dehydrogenase PreA subunit
MFMDQILFGWIDQCQRCTSPGQQCPNKLATVLTSLPKRNDEMVRQLEVCYGCAAIVVCEDKIRTYKSSPVRDT